MSQRTVEINVNDRKLKVACPRGQETALLNAAAELSERIIKASTSKVNSTPEQALLMSALNLANDLLEIQQKLLKEKQENKAKITLLQSTIEQALKPRSIQQA